MKRETARFVKTRLSFVQVAPFQPPRPIYSFPLIVMLSTIVDGGEERTKTSPRTLEIRRYVNGKSFSRFTRAAPSSFVVTTRVKRFGRAFSMIRSVASRRRGRGVKHGSTKHEKRSRLHFATRRRLGCAGGKWTLVKFDDVTDDTANYSRGNGNVGHLTH